MEGLEFEEMRKQIAILKEKIQKEEIVNDRLLRQVSKSKLSVMNAQAFKNLIISLSCVPLYLLMYYQAHLSLTFCLCTIIYVLFCAFGTMYIHYPVMKMNMATEDLKSVACKVARVKRQYHFWLVYVTPTIIPWLGWCLYEMLKAFQLEFNSTSGIVFTVFVFLSAAIGFAIGFSMHKKVVNACSDMLEQINGD